MTFFVNSFKNSDSWRHEIFLKSIIFYLSLLVYTVPIYIKLKGRIIYIAMGSRKKFDWDVVKNNKHWPILSLALMMMMDPIWFILTYWINWRQKNMASSTPLWCWIRIYNVWRYLLSCIANVLPKWIYPLLKYSKPRQYLYHAQQELNN